MIYFSFYYINGINGGSIPPIVVLTLMQAGVGGTHLPRRNGTRCTGVRGDLPLQQQTNECYAVFFGTA